MKLLFDENLAPSLVSALADIFPQSEHVARVGLGALSDREVWEYAREHRYTLVSSRWEVVPNSQTSGAMRCAYCHPTGHTNRVLH